MLQIHFSHVKNHSHNPPTTSRTMNQSPTKILCHPNKYSYLCIQIIKSEHMNNYRLHISNSVEHHFIDIDHLLYVKSNGNYCMAVLDDGTEISNIPKQLGQISRLINNTLPPQMYGSLIQTGRFHIINTQHIQSIYIKRKLIIFDTTSPLTSKRFAISTSPDSLTKLCDFMSKTHPTQTEYTTYANEETMPWDNEYEYDDNSFILLGSK